jgi:ribosomal-protein-alanine N-acetyltransferase
VRREARPGDWPAIEGLQQHLSEPAPALLAEAAGGEVLVSTASSRDDERPVGYLLWFPGNPVYVAEVVVHPNHRRQGRARGLFRELFVRLPAGRAVDLRVAVENEATQRLYRQLGFETVERLPDAYESGAGSRMRAVVGTDADARPPSSG